VIVGVVVGRGVCNTRSFSLEKGWFVGTRSSRERVENLAGEVGGSGYG